MNVNYRARALEDVHAIYQWRARQSTDVAEKVETAIFAAADWLGEHLKFGSKTDEANVRRWPNDRLSLHDLLRYRQGSGGDRRIAHHGRAGVRDLKRVPR